MSTGLPVILSDNTGMSEFCNNEYNYPIRTEKITPSFRYPTKWGDVGNWYEPDYHHFKELMKYKRDENTNEQKKMRYLRTMV